MVKYIYICSAGHSGSTLLDLLIGSHTSIASLGEISQLPKNISLNTLCTCGIPVRECPVWKKVVSRISNKIKIDLWEYPYKFNLGYINPKVIIDKRHVKYRYKIERKIIHSLWFVRHAVGLSWLDYFLNGVYKSIYNNKMLYDYVIDELNVGAVVDSSKYYMKALELYKRFPGIVKIILLTRDGRGVAYSGSKRNFNINKRIIGWKKHYSRAIFLFEKHVNNQDILKVRYEDIALDPHVQLTRICDFIGVEFERQMIDFASHIHHSTNGNDMRFSTSSEIKADFEWLDKLSFKERQSFEMIAGRLNRKLGYK